MRTPARSSVWILAPTLTVLVVISGLLGTPASPPVASPVAGAPATPAQVPHAMATPENIPWGSYMFNAGRTGDNSNETTLNTSNVPALHLLWEATLGGAVEDQPLVAYGRVYVASWDGYEYAYYASNGSLDWRTYIGQTQFSNCYASHPRGTTATPTIVNGTLYTLGGDPYFYALNATTGQELWNVSEKVNNPSSGDYNWGSPVVAGSTGYVGLASACNNPGSQGMILSINLNGTTHAVQHSFAIVPSTQSGGGVWSTGAVDGGANLLWMTIGDEVSASSGYYRSVLALNATTLAKVGYWQQPTSGTDFDFGAGPTLFHDVNGRALVAATNKNGQVYAFNRSNVSSSGWSPIWTANVSWYDNASPQQACGCALAPAAFDGRTLYLGGGYARLSNGTNVAGSVRAVVPSDGTFRWSHASPGIVRAGVTVANGLVYDAADPNNNTSGILEVLDASTGQRLFGYVVNQTVNAPVTVAEGRVYFVSANWNNSGVGHLYALGLTLATQHTAPAGAVPVGTLESYAASSAGGTPPYRYTWDFGEGSANATGANVQHAFDRVGNFTTRLATVDSVGAQVTSNWTTDVVPVPLSIAQFLAYPDPVVVNSTVDWTVNVVGGYGALAYSYTSLPPGCVGVSLPSFNCTPSSTGTYPVEVTVRDAVGTAAHAVRNLTVSGVPPPGPSVASFTVSPAVVDVGGWIWINVSVSGGASPLSFAYTGLPMGCPDQNRPMIHCQPTVVGTSTLQVQVTDLRGLKAAATAYLSVLPAAVVVPQIASFSVSPASAVVNATVQFSLRISGDAQRDAVAYQDLPSPCVSKNVTNLTCVPGSVGTFHVRVIVTDPSGGVADANVTLAVVAMNSSSPSPSGGAGLLGFVWWAVGVAAVVLVVGVILSRRASR